MHSMLKDDGLVGVVQHRAPETADNHWALGNAGYLKQSHVITMFEKRVSSWWLLARLTLMAWITPLRTT